MSDPTAKIVFGFPIGDTRKWLVNEAPENPEGIRDSLVLPWYSDEDVELQGRFIELAWVRLYNAIPGSTPVENNADAEAPARSYYGIDFERCGTATQTVWLMTATDMRLSVTYSDTLQINAGTLQQRPLIGRYAEKLRKALKILGVTPVQTNPNWLLASLYF